jgi:hypothetical protein
MGTTHPVTKKIASRSFNYTNDCNPQMNRVEMNIKYPG